MTYILRIAGRPVDYTLTEKLVVHFLRRHKATGETIGGMFRMMEPDGIDENVLEFYAGPHHRDDPGPKPTSGRGRSPARSWHRAARRQSEVHKHVRRMRAVDAARIGSIDDKIESLRIMIGELQNERYLFVQQAWRHGLDVPLAEVVAIAENKTPT